ncbi:MFS transporter [Aquitalea pelogenes]|uniref:MFS transporter n=1 Tax=Aquitalea pelogenes TaxID=1293573 RepID=UPI0007884E2F|nr:MFS transporter [Aquitalea pelogenes]
MTGMAAADVVVTEGIEERAYRKAARKLIPLLFLCYIVAFLDRANIGFAKLQMAGDLQFSDAIYAAGAGVFFWGYFFFEVPSNLMLERYGAKVWIARIMVTWGLISSAFMFTGDIKWGPLATLFQLSDAEFTFYLLRFLLGAAEAGFFPGIILYLTYWFPGERRAKMLGLFMTAVGVSQLLGSPLSGAIMQYMDGSAGWRGWQWLFLLEGMPSVLIGFMVLAVLPNGPQSAKWLTTEERQLLTERIASDNAAKSGLAAKHRISDAFKDGRVWALAVAYLALQTCFYAVGFWMPTIIQELGFDKKELLQVGLVSMIPWGASIITMVYWGARSDRTGERRWHCATGFLLQLAGLVVLGLAAQAPVLSMLGLTLITIGWAACMVTFWTLPTAFLAGTAAAAGIAWVNSLGNLGGTFGPMLIATIRDAANGRAETAFFGLAAVALAGALIVLLLRQTQAQGKARI